MVVERNVAIQDAKRLLAAGRSIVLLMEVVFDASLLAAIEWRLESYNSAGPMAVVHGQRIHRPIAFQLLHGKMFQQELRSSN